jgi:uncharacterized protein involved in outer membrane biogenesis
MDSTGDTLVYAGRMNAEIASVKIFERSVKLDKISLINPFINIKTDSAGNSNYEYLLRKFESEEEDTSASPEFSVFAIISKFLMPELKIEMSVIQQLLVNLTFQTLIFRD